jgi:hypothetical protein
MGADRLDALNGCHLRNVFPIQRREHLARTTKGNTPVSPVLLCHDITFIPVRGYSAISSIPGHLRVTVFFPEWWASINQLPGVHPNCANVLSKYMIFMPFVMTLISECSMYSCSPGRKRTRSGRVLTSAQKIVAPYSSYLGTTSRIVRTICIETSYYLAATSWPRTTACRNGHKGSISCTLVWVSSTWRRERIPGRGTGRHGRLPTRWRRTGRISRRQDGGMRSQKSPRRCETSPRCLQVRYTYVVKPLRAAS